MFSTLLCMMCVVGTGEDIRIQGSSGLVREGPWRAWLQSPGGELPFGLEFRKDDSGWHAAIINGAERIEVPRLTVGPTEVVLQIPHYDSTISAKLLDGGRRLEGEWKKRGRNDKWTKMAFYADAGDTHRFAECKAAGGQRASGKAVAGRWAMKFTADTDPAIGVFEAGEGVSVVGTVLTPTGDYRYLAGDFCGTQKSSSEYDGQLRLSAFDGAHAFLLTATTTDGATLSGDFWSGETFHDTWSAKRDESATLPDGFTLTRGVETAKLSEVMFPDLDGKKHSLADPAFAGKVRIIEVFGSWCPNCHDASTYLVELHRKYKGRGLSIVGLAFEYTGDFQRDAEQVRAFAKYHKIEYPLLLAGVADREKASAALPIIDKLRAFPTIILLDAEGKDRAVYTGFSGPATGDEYTKFRTKFESLIEELLGGPKSGPG
jgi:thiol-disulfide isomerase/thioredoxin